MIWNLTETNAEDVNAVRIRYKMLHLKQEIFGKEIYNLENQQIQKTEGQALYFESYFMKIILKNS